MNCINIAFSIITYNMIPSIKYISPALLFNKSFLKLYIYIVSGLFLNYSLLLFIDLLLNRVVLTLHCISWFKSDLLLYVVSYNVDSSTIIMLVIIALIST